MSEDRYTGIEGRIYDRGYHDGCIAAKRRAEVDYAGKLAEITGEEAFQELAAQFERERIEAVYEAWEKISHCVSAIVELIEAEPKVSKRTRWLADDVRAEVDNAYLSASDDYETLKYLDEEFADQCRKERGRA